MHQLIAKTRMRQVLLVLGLVGLFISARMTYAFGRTMTFDHAMLLVGVTLLAGIIFAAREILVVQRDSWGARAALGVGVLFILVELFSHVGYTVGMRVGSVERAETQNARYDDQRDNVKESQGSLTLWRDRLAKMEKEHAWVATVTATGLRAKLPTMDKAIELETRRGGCKSLCKLRMEEKAELEKQIAIAEEADKARAQIAGVQSTLVSFRDKSAVTTKGDTTVKHQTFWVSQIAAMSLTPDVEMRTAVEIAISLLLAVAGVLFAPTCLWLWARLAVELDQPAHLGQRRSSTVSSQSTLAHKQPQEEATVEVRKIGEGAPTPAQIAAASPLGPIEVDVPIHVRANVTHEGSDIDTLLPTRRITRASQSGNAFARRIADITAHLRSKAAA